MKGRLFVHRNVKKWKQNAVFENVEHMGQALEAQRQGKNLEQEFEEHRREVGKAQSLQSPRNAPSALRSDASKELPRSSNDSGRRTDQPALRRRSADHTLVPKQEPGPSSDGASDATDSNPAHSSGKVGDGDHDRASTEIAGRQTGTAVVDQAMQPEFSRKADSSPALNQPLLPTSSTAEAPQSADKPEVVGQANAELPGGLLKHALSV